MSVDRVECFFWTSTNWDSASRDSLQALGSDGTGATCTSGGATIFVMTDAWINGQSPSVRASTIIAENTQVFQSSFQQEFLSMSSEFTFGDNSERMYPELLGLGRRAQLVVIGVEVGRRWSHEMRSFFSQLAKVRARGERPLVRRRAERTGRRSNASIVLPWATQCVGGCPAGVGRERTVVRVS